MALRRSGRTTKEPARYYEEYAGPAPKKPPKKKTVRTGRVAKKATKKGKTSKANAGAQSGSKEPESNHWHLADDRPGPDELPQSDEVMAELKWHGSTAAMNNYGLLPQDVRSWVRNALRQHAAEDDPARVQFEPILASMVGGVSAIAPVIQLPGNSGPDPQAFPTTPTHQVQNSSLKPAATPAVYNIEKQYTTPQALGEAGSQGEIFKAKDKQTGQTVALKKYVVNDDDEDGHLTNVLRGLPDRVVMAYYKDRMSRAVREIKWLSQHTHDNIIKYEAISFWEGTFTFVMPLYDNNIWFLESAVKKAVGNLQARKFKHLQQQKISEAYWMLWTQMLDAFAFLEMKGVVHLDVKPWNIFFRREIKYDPRNIAWKFVLGDFGVAEYAGDLAWSRVGTTEYIAPENREWPFGVSNLHHSASDVWSLYKTVTRVAVPLHFHYGKHRAELKAAKPIKDDELRTEPFTPWFKMLNDDPLERPTFKEALELTQVKENDWSQTIPKWFVDENGTPPKKIRYKVNHDNDISRSSDNLSPTMPVEIEDPDNDEDVESPTAALRERRGAPGA